MKRTLIVTGALLALAATPALATNNDQLVNESRAAIKAFMGAMKGEMKKALKAGGPVKAIEVCNKKAAPIAEKLSKEKGMELARTSLKTRNTENKPDAWEQAVMEKFETRKTAGEDPKKMEYSEVVEMDGKSVFRYMKAIPTAEKPCLACHGAKIKPEVASKLDKLYPEDKARGFKPGDIRGAFTISKTLK